MTDNEAGKRVPSGAGSGCCRVDRKLLPIKLLFFLFSGGSHSFLAYRSLFYKHLGFASTQVGLFYLIEALFASAVVPAVAWTADRLHRPRLFVIATLIVGSLSDLAQFNIPYAAVPHSGTIETNQTLVQTSMVVHAAPGIYKPGDSFIPTQARLDGAEANSTSCVVADVQPSGTASNCTGVQTNLTCLNVTCSSATTTPNRLPRPNEPRAEKTLFVHAVVLVMASSLGHFAAASLIQSLMMNLLQQRDDGCRDDGGAGGRSRYGRQLMWGAVGSGLFMWTVGALKDVVADARGKEDKFMFAPMFLCSSVLMMSAALVAWQLDYDRSGEASAATANDGDRIRIRDIKEVMVRPRTLMFLVVLLVYGIDQAIVQGFVFWFGESKLRASGTILGASALVGNLAVLPFFACADDVIRRCGAELVVVGAMFAFAARFYLYTIASAGWQMIPMELFRVVTYSLAYTAVCTYARSLAPPGGEATTMAIVYVVIKTIGCGAGSAIGGAVFSSWGGDFLFRSASLLSLAAALVYGIYVLADGAVARRRRRESYLDVEMSLRQGDDKAERVELCQFPT